MSTNPQISPLSEKIELKKIHQNVKTMENRVQLLRQQLQKEKDSVQKHKNLVKEVIQKKIDVNKINQFKLKDNSDEERKIEELRKRNRMLREQHAIYLVKLDDAREVKNISIEHQKRIKDRERLFLSAQQEKKNKIAQESEKAKERYMDYWRQKLQSIYTEQAQTLLNTMNQKQQKKKQLNHLQEEEARLLKQINRVHSIQIQSKKQYLAALSLPVKEVADAIQEQISPKRSNVNKSTLTINRKLDSLSEYSERRISMDSGIRIPNANVNQSKLKIILNQLKKQEKGQSRYI